MTLAISRDSICHGTRRLEDTKLVLEFPHGERWYDERNQGCLLRVSMPSCAAILLLVLSSVPAEAQELFPRFDFHLDAEYVASGDPRFNWFFDFGGDVDVVRSDTVRALFIANYEAIAGEQFRRFDVNQGNYMLEGAILFRVAGVELGPVWHHMSRHLSDRPKRFPIDWNMISVRVRDAHTRGRLDMSWRADVRATVTNAFVDYSWEFETQGGLGYQLTPRFDVTARNTWRVVGVDGSRGRGTQLEGRIEAGVRMRGTAAAAELYIGAERRIDPYPIEFATASWLLAGLRLTSR